MVWNFPEISLQEMSRLIKGFVDIMILASGYQSSGLLACWDAHNIKKALQWGSFFETVLKRMSNSNVYEDSVKELDAVLSEMTSAPSFPQGLASLSCVTLCEARRFVLAHLFHVLPLRDSQLRAFLTAIVEMDLDNHSDSKHNFIVAYLNKLMLQNAPFDTALELRGFVKDSKIASEDMTTVKVGNCNDGDLTSCALQELIDKQSIVSCISTIETGLDVLSNTIRSDSWIKSDDHLFKQQSKSTLAPATRRTVGKMVDFVTWDRWRLESLSYFFDKRSVRLVSGANLIFSAPKIQWVRMFEQLNTSSECKDDDLLETIELLLLGCIASKWNCIIEHFMSASYESSTISKLYHYVCNLLPGEHQNFYSKEEATNSKETGILEYLVVLLGGQYHLLWKLSPVLTAVAIPLWSPLFRLYLREIETRFKGDCSKMSCIEDMQEHIDCQLAERIWCLHVFHVCGSHLACGADNPSIMEH